MIIDIREYIKDLLISSLYLIVILIQQINKYILFDFYNSNRWKEKYGKSNQIKVKFIFWEI